MMMNQQQLLASLYCLCALLLLTTSSANAYTTNSAPNAKKPLKKNHNHAFATAAATAALSVLLTTAEPAMAASSSKLAAQIQLNSIPPTSVQVNIQDLPLVGDILSGTYMKVQDPSVVPNPSITIASPKDKIGAIKSAATNGHLEFDVNGVIGTHLDIDVSAEEAGVAKVRVASPLIPQLPFKNPAASAPTASGSKGESEWFVVTNMGSGESYYYNQKTGDTTYQKPKSF